MTMEINVPKILAATSFFGSTAEPTRLDAYTTAGNGVYSKITDIAGKLGIDPSGLLRGSEWVKKNLPLIKNVYSAGKAVVNGKNLVSQIAAGTSLFKNGLPLLAGALPANVTSSISNMITQHSDTIVKLGNVAEMVKGADLTNLQNVGDMLSNLTGQNGLFEIKDKSSIVGVMSGLCVEGCKLGVPGAVSAVLGSTNGRDMLQSCMANVMPELVKLGKLGPLEEVGNFCKSKGFELAGIGGYDKFLKDFKLGDVNPSNALGTFSRYLDTAKNLDATSGIMSVAGSVYDSVFSKDELSKDAMQCLKSDYLSGEVPSKFAATIVSEPLPPTMAETYLAAKDAEYVMPGFTTPGTSGGSITVRRL